MCATKKLLVLGAGNAQTDLIEYCKSIGLQVHGCSYSDTDTAISLLDHFAKINIVNSEAVENYVSSNDIDYIYSIGSDIAIPTMCRVAENTNKFHFVSSRTADLCCNKNLMREVIGVDSRFNIPFLCCSSLAETRHADFYPMMIKPVDSQGQRGVFCAENFEQLSHCFNKSIQYSKSARVILEKYIPGKEVSVNAYVKDKKVIFSLLSDRESFGNLPGGIIKAHHIPSVFEGSDVHKKILQLIEEVITKLQIENGPVYFQIKVSSGTPYLIEVTPRLDGCHMWRLIKTWCGVDLLEMTISHLLGRSIEDPDYTPRDGRMHLEFFCQRPGTNFSTDKHTACTADYKRFYYQTDDQVKQLNGYMEKCGYRIFSSPQTVALIGGSGFIGQHLAIYLSDNTQIVDVSRKSGTVSEYSVLQLKQAMRGCDSAVILAARKVDPNTAQSLSLYEDNQKTTENALIACRELGIKNVVYTSSRCVYANNQPAPVPEDGIIEPINYYGISKYCGELLCTFYNRNFGMNIKVLRLSQVLGELGNGYLLDFFIQNALSNKPLNVFGQAIGQRDYIYVKDVCRAIWLALLKYEITGVYNIGSGIGTSSLDMATTVIESFEADSHVQLLPNKPEDTSTIYLDVKKARDELGFSCKYDLSSALKDLKFKVMKGEGV